MSLSTNLKKLSGRKPLQERPRGDEEGSRPDTGGGTLISARKIQVSGQWGQVFGPLDLDIDRGGLNLIAAPPGAARTAFLMALCGRMKLKSGRLTVLGQTDHRAVFEESNIACFDELDAPQPSVTVQDLVTEQIRWNSNFFKWVPLATTEDLKEMCGYLFEGLELPPIDAFVADLPELHQLLLRVGVANTRRPPLLVIGRLDKISDEDQHLEFIDRLAKLGEEQSVIAADVNANDFEDKVSEVIEVPELLEFQQRIRPARELAGDSTSEGGDVAYGTKPINAPADKDEEPGS